MTPHEMKVSAGNSARSAPYRRSDARFVAIAASVVFLALPFPIFFWFWFKPAVALGLIIAVGFLSVWIAHQLAQAWLGDAEDHEPVSLKVVAWLLLGSIAVLALTGVGGLFHQTSDWVKHNAMLGTLLREPWPPAVATDTQIFQLSYYIAWYMPAMLFGKLAGWTGANLFLLTYSACGVALVFFLSSRLTGARLPLVFAVFLAFSGLDVLGQFLMGQVSSLPTASEAIQRDEWWAAAFQYSGNVTLLYYVPHQAIAGWLLTALMAAGIRYGLPLPMLCFCAPISFFWVPWVTIGILPIGLFFVVRQLFGTPLKEVIFIGRRPSSDLAAYAAAGVTSLALVVYYSTRFTVTEAEFVPPPRGYLDYTPGILYFSGLKFVAAYAIFIAVEVGGFLALCWWILRDTKDRLFKELLLAAAVILLVLPTVRYGFFNDLTMRASIPALYLLVLIVCFCLARGTAAIKRTALIAFLVVCFGNVLLVNRQNIERNFTTDWNFLMAFKEHEILTLQCLHEQRGVQVRWNLLRQYVGKPAWSIHQLLLKAPVIPPEGALKRLPPPLPPGGDRIAAACAKS